MIKYVNSFKILLFSIVAVQIAMYFFGYLRPSIIYDYIDFFPFTIIPAVLYFYLNIKRITNRIYFYLSIYLSAILLLFPIAQIFDANFLTTYSYDSDFENLNLDENFEYQLYIDENNSIEYTINPDFSQVEADAAQILVNETFAVSLEEKRTFFLEGTDLLDTDLDSVYTRSINSY